MPNGFQSTKRGLELLDKEFELWAVRAGWSKTLHELRRTTKDESLFPMPDFQDSHPRAIAHNKGMKITLP